MINFLKTLFGQPSDANIIEFPELDVETLCYVMKDASLSASPNLMVGAGQVAVLFNQKDRSNLYLTGDHELTKHEKRFLNQHSQANILFVQVAPPVIRRWSIILTPCGADKIMLSGQYAVTVENAKILCDHLLQPAIKIATTTIDQWITNVLKEVMQAQHITVEDINTYRSRLENFLMDAINPIIADKGLSLRGLKISEVSESDTDILEKEAVIAAAEKENAQMNNDDKSINAANSIDKQSAPDNKQHEFEQFIFNDKDDGPREYYRILNGQQDGPYSVYQMQQLLAQKSLKPSSLVWKKGFSSWQRADSIDELT